MKTATKPLSKAAIKYIKIMFDGGKTKPEDLTKEMVSVFKENLRDEPAPGSYFLDREIVNWFNSKEK